MPVVSFPDLTNRQIGYLFVIGLVEVGSLRPKDRWLCCCSCSGFCRQVIVSGFRLRSGLQISCGCLRELPYTSASKNRDRPPDAIGRDLDVTLQAL